MITTRAVLDHETRDQFTVKVVARDGGNPAKSSQTTVEVNVVDINESPPQFDQPSMTFIIRENKPPGTSLGFVTANDPDSGENGQVQYYITGGNLFGTFGVNRTTGEFIVERPVDFEMFSSYSIVIRAVDNNAVNPLSSTIIVNVTVLDENDNAPLFEEDPVVVRLIENLPQNTQVYQFRAMDADSGSSGQIKYHIMSQSPNSDWFTIDSNTGVLKVNRPINYEEITQVSVVVMAADQPPNRDETLSSTVTALMFIEDVNDNAPHFQTRSDIHLMEDEPVGYPILHVVATDIDSGHNGRVSYFIISGNTNNHFHLHSSNGKLYLLNIKS